MIIIGLDPATLCGWSIVKDGKLIASGTWNLKGGRHEGGGMRYLRARRYFEELLINTDVTAVAYEEVRRHQGVDAAHVYGGIVGQVTAVCEEKGVPFKAIPVATIKKLATGSGKANKDAMIAAANNHFGISVIDDNEADAIWCALALEKELA